jgi:integrase
MSRLKNQVPKMYPDRGRAYVKLSGQRIALGPWASDEADENYRRAIAEWLSNDRHVPPREDEQVVTVTEVCVAFLKHAQRRQSPGDLDHIRAAFKVLRGLYGSEPVESFGPKRLRIVRDRIIAKNHVSRGTINKRIRWIRRAFKWAASMEMCDERIYRRLDTVDNLKRGEGGKEPRKVRPVPRCDIRRVRRHLPRPVRALVDLQLLTGARPGELVRLCAAHIDMSEKTWSVTYDGTDEQKSHKTDYLNKERVIWFGRRAQKILQMFMSTGRRIDQPIFTPKQACLDAAQRRGNHGRRANQKPNARKTDRTVGDQYTTASYRRAIHRVCKQLGVPTWGPHRLRHNAATALRNEFGLDVASAVLDHGSLTVTTLYAELNRKKARDAIAKVG